MLSRRATYDTVCTVRKSLLDRVKTLYSSVECSSVQYHFWNKLLKAYQTPICSNHWLAVDEYSTRDSCSTTVENNPALLTPHHYSLPKQESPGVRRLLIIVTQSQMAGRKKVATTSCYIRPIAIALCFGRSLNCHSKRCALYRNWQDTVVISLSEVSSKVSKIVQNNVQYSWEVISCSN